MREIKFRYTVIRENGYVFSGIFTLEQIEKGEVKIWSEMNHVNMDAVKKNQFIGLHDKTDREIYEGDIVHYIYLPGKTFWNYEGDAIIEWSSTGYWMKPLPGKGGVDAALVSIPGAYEPTCRKLFEVIGNRFENPELLEAVK